MYFLFNHVKRQKQLNEIKVTLGGTHRYLYFCKLHSSFGIPINAFFADKDAVQQLAKNNNYIAM